MNKSSLYSTESMKEALTTPQGIKLEANSISKYTSVMLGVASLIGWSAILNSFDFFALQFPKETYGDVTFLFPIPLKFATFIWGLFMDHLTKKFSLKQRIAGCLIIQSFLMVAMPLVALYIQNRFGFWICMLLSFLIGTTTCISQNSSIALISTFDDRSSGIYWIFTAWSGLSMNVGRAIVLLIFGDNDDGINQGTIIYFAMAAVLIYTTVFTLYKFVASPYYELTQKALPVAEDNIGELFTDHTIQQKSANGISEQDSTFKKRLIVSFKKVKFIALSIFFTYIVTFMLFPGVSIYQKHYTLISSFSWATLLMQMSYNIGDLSGKALSSIPFYNSVGMYIVNLCRVGFFFTFLMTVHSDSAFFTNDIFSFVNIFLFGATNGLATGGLMQLGPKRAENKDEQTLISFIDAFSLTFGISVGAFLALTLSSSD